MDTIRLKYWKPWFLSFTALLAVTMIFLLAPDYQVSAMLKLEFAKSPGAFFNVIEHYNYSDTLLRKYIYIDFIYIVAFSAFFVMSLRLVFELAELDKKNHYLLFCLVPGAFDVIENLLMLYMIRNNSIAGYGFDVFVAVVIAKWTCVIPFILMSLIVVVYQLLIRISKIYDSFERRS